MRKRVATIVALGALLALGLGPATASAAFHLTKIREVYPGTMAFFDSAYVELQAYQPGQNLLTGHKITFYDAGGILVHTFTFPAGVPNAQTQSTVLVGDMFPPNAVSSDFTDTALGSNIIPSGGAACFDAIPVDCVAWGGFTPGGIAALPGAVGTPASPSGIPDGSALTRSIFPGCATLLEASDDTDSSSVDFSVTATKNPRPNSVAPTEVACAPETAIDKGPKKKIKARTAKFKFSSPDAGATFECALDKKPRKPCSSPFTIKRVKKGKHVFRVRAVLNGTPDPTPATYKFKRKRR